MRQVLLSDVVRMDGGRAPVNGDGGGDAWRVMVLDARATRVISSVVGMYDIMEGQVTVVEDLHKVCIVFRAAAAAAACGARASSLQAKADAFWDTLACVAT